MITQQLVGISAWLMGKMPVAVEQCKQLSKLVAKIRHFKPGEACGKKELAVQALIHICLHGRACLRV